MDIEYYRNFITIVECGNLSRAAEVINIAQPALSYQVKILEAMFGAQLINLQRGVRKLELTEAGHILFRYAQDLVSLEDNLRTEIADCVNGETASDGESRYAPRLRNSSFIWS